MPWCKRTHPTTVPSWCRLAPDEWVRFRDCSRTNNSCPWRCGLSCRTCHGHMRQLDGFTFDFSLDCLVNAVCHLPLAEWAPTIEGYFADQPIVAEGDPAQPRRPRLRLRALAPSPLAPPPGLSVGEVGLRRDLGSDPVAVLEVEGPQTIHRITPRDAAAWGTSGAELWSIALEKLRQGDHEVTRQDPGFVVTGRSNYVASHALRLGELRGGPARYDVLVAVPHPFMVLYIPSLGVDPALLLLRLPEVVDQLHDDEFGTLSRHIYRWKDELFDDVGVAEVEGNVTITGSKRFAALLNRLLKRCRETHLKAGLSKAHLSNYSARERL